jgi:DNA repair photolyase
MRKANGKKVRSDAKLWRLTEEQQRQVVEWCDKEGYSAAAGKVWKECRVRVAVSTLQDFYREWSLLEDWKAAQLTASAAQRQMEEFDPENAEKAEAFGQFVFTQQALMARDAKTFVALQSLALDKKVARTRAELEAAKLKLTERRVVVAEARVRAASAVSEAGKKLDVSPEVLKQIMEAVDRKILGIE